MLFLLLLISLTSGIAMDDCVDCSDIKVTVIGFHSGKGEGFLALYTSKDGYPLDPAKALQKLKSPIQDGKATFELTSIKPGSYALIAMHDENRNGRMDRNLLGMPKEGYGASNNPKMPLLGPPTFESAKFVAQPGVMTMEIPLHYYPR